MQCIAFSSHLRIIKPEHRDAFVGFVRTGELDDIFREYLDADLGAQQALELAFDHRMKGLRAVRGPYSRKRRQSRKKNGPINQHNIFKPINTPSFCANTS